MRKIFLQMTKPLLAAFDFDHTVVEENTDIVVRHLLKDKKALAEIRGMYTANGWTLYMEKIFEFLHDNKVTSVDIEAAISTIPAVAALPSLLERLHSSNAEIIIISDSNSVFINHWLKVNNLDHTVKEVFTNPAWFEESGLLKIEMYHLQDWCKLSSRNLCKGQILESHVEKRSKEGVTFERIAYVGDGTNDLCPVLRLSERDLAFPRVQYPLMNILSKPDADAERVPKAEIVPWTDGMGIWQELSKRIPELDKPDPKP